MISSVEGRSFIAAALLGLTLAVTGVAMRASEERDAPPPQQFCLLDSEGAGKWCSDRPIIWHRIERSEVVVR